LRQLILSTSRTYWLANSISNYFISNHSHFRKDGVAGTWGYVVEDVPEESS